MQTLVGMPAPEFSLEDQDGRRVRLADLLARGPVMLAFYPGDFRIVCTKQLCDYRDRQDEFAGLGIQIVGVSADLPEEHKRFSQEHRFAFPLLCDPGRKTAKAYGCASLLMLGNQSRAVFVIGRDGKILYRYVEPTIVTRRGADELMGILKGLRDRRAL
jgi:peroxiredoxin Q/BCP